MTKLSDTQLVILNRAAQRDDHGVTAIDKRAATREAIEALLKQKLLKTVSKTADLALWTRSEDGPLGLALTPKGLKALDLGEPVSTPGEAEPSATKPTRKSRTNGTPAKAAASVRKTSNKTETVLALLRRPTGADLAELMTATGWQAHSVRGFLSGTVKTKLGLSLISEKQDKIRLYRIEA